LTPFFSANRSVCEYIDQYYLPAAAAYRERASGNGVVAADMVNWLRSLEQKWANLRLGEVSVASGGECHSFEVQVYLNGLKPIDVNVELYADEVNGSNPVRQGMIQGRQLVGAENGYLYNARVPAARPAKDYTVRVIPQYPGASIPLEISQILWQK
jgi:starch phosphorylase